MTDGVILLVDDETLVIEELAESLEMDGYTVETADNVAAALDHPDLPNASLIVTDLKMPGASGLDLLRELRDRDSQAPVIVLSGHGAESDREEATALGAVACFAKPVDLDVLLAAIEGELNRITAPSGGAY